MEVMSLIETPAYGYVPAVKGVTTEGPKQLMTPSECRSTVQEALPDNRPLVLQVVVAPRDRSHNSESGVFCIQPLLCVNSTHQHLAKTTFVSYESRMSTECLNVSA